MKLRRRPEDRPASHQVEAVRAELHAIVDRACRDWLDIEAMSGQIGGGGGGGESRRGSGHSDPTLSAVLAGGDAAGQWVDRFRRFRVEARLMDAARARLAPAKAKPGRENTVEVCARCGLPNPKMHRRDGIPYCATTCYFAVWREHRAARANVQTLETGRWLT